MKSFSLPKPAIRDLVLSESQRSVLDVIWRRGPIARVDISPITELSVMSVTRIVKDLLDLGLLEEGINRTGLRGSPARPLTIRPDAAYACGVYFTTSAMRLGLVNLAGELIAEIDEPMASRLPEVVAHTANTLIGQMIGELSLKPDQMVGVGFALPGDFVFDRKRLVAHPMFPEFGNGDLAQILAEAVDYPIFVENDAACAALGERMMGIGQELSNFFFLHLGHGVGGGLVIDGKLYRGSHGNSGIIGIQFPNDRPRPSGQDLFESLRAEGVAVSEFGDLQSLRTQTCPPLKRWIGRAAEQLREGLWVTARILDPEAIIVGGRMPTHLLQELVAKIDNESFCNEGVLLPRPKLFASALGPAAGVIGAACVPIHHCFFKT